MKNFEQNLNNNEKDLSDSAMLKEKVKQTANYEGNQSLLLFERLRSPIIHKQLVTHFENAYQAYEKEGNADTRWKKDDKGAYIYENDGSHSMENVLSMAPTYEEIVNKIEKTLKEEEHSTVIDYANKAPDTSCMHLGWTDSRVGNKPTQKGWSAMEAHEKGHGIRLYGGKAVRKYFSDLFKESLDLNALDYTEETFEKEKTLYDNGTTYKDAVEIAREYFGDPKEIAERMSQLKNYFGMKGAEEFTKLHLEYSRKHYIDDVMDNGMTEFFNAITPEKEEYFLKLINSVGI